MVLYLIIYSDRYLLDRVPLRLREVSSLLHLSYNEIAADQGLVRIQGRIVPGRLVDHSHESGALLYGEVGRLLREEGLRCGPYAIGIAAEEDGIEIHVHDLLLGVVTLELDGGYPFFQLDNHQLDLGYAGDSAAYVCPGIQCLRKLLGDGASASLAGIAEEQCLHEHPSETLEINAGMVVEPSVLGCHRRLHKIWRKFVVGYEGTVLDMESREYLAVIGNDLRSQLALGILEFLERRNVGECPHEENHCKEEQHRS